MLSTHFYQDQKIFEQERKKIFSSLWIFFSLVQEFGASDANSDGAYVRKKIAGQDIFIRKTGDQYVGFINRCPHRFHPIVQAEWGKAPLVCPYHFWAFENDGKLKGIPYEKECYQFSQEKKETIALTRVAVKRMGSLLFVNLSKKPIAFEKQFSGFYLDRVRELSIHFEHYRKISLNRRFNWKFIQENLRDGLHPAFLHKNTLLNGIAFGPPAIPKDVPLPLLRLKDASFGGPDVALTRAFDQKEFFTDPWVCEERYYNYHLFPGLHIAAADGGYSFVLENYLPVSPEQTQIEIYFVLTPNALDFEQENALFDQLIANALAVYEEDFAALEAIQGSLSTRQGSQVFPINGVYERLITRFQKVYLKMLGYQFFLKDYLWDLRAIPKFVTSYINQNINKR